MLEEVIKGIAGMVWAIMRAIILDVITMWLQRAIMAAIVYPIGATGQMARAASSGQMRSYNGRYLGRVCQQAVIGTAVLIILLAGAYLLFGRVGVLVAGGFALLIVTLGWLNRLVVPYVD